MLSDVVKNRRALFLSMGLTKEEIAKPLIGVVNSQNELVPGHIHLDEIAKAVREGILSAGVLPWSGRGWKPRSHHHHSRQDRSGVKGEKGLPDTVATTGCRLAYDKRTSFRNQ